MIRKNEPISMAETIEYIKKVEDSEGDLKGFIKKFIKLTPKEAIEMRKSLEKHKMMKMKPEHTAKIIDLMPENAEDLNKIFTDIGLDEDETKKILETVKQFK